MKDRWSHTGVCDGSVDVVGIWLVGDGSDLFEECGDSGEETMGAIAAIAAKKTTAMMSR